MVKLFIPNNLTRAQLDAFRSVEVELGKLSRGNITTGDGVPTETNQLQDGAFYYDYTNLNLYVFRLADKVWRNSTLNAVIDANSQIDAITDNIYTPGVTTIDGDKLTAGSVTADKIIIDDNIEFTSNASGLIFNKTSITDGTHGSFYGRGTNSAGASVAGFAVSSPTSSILFDSSGTFKLVGVDLYTGAQGTPTTFFNTGTTLYAVPADTVNLNITIIGGGGGGANNAPSSGGSGGSGASSSVKMYSGPNGTGTLLETHTAAGGAGATWVDLGLPWGTSRSGIAGQASTVAAGGSGSTAQPMFGTAGSGGGTPGGGYIEYIGAQQNPVVRTGGQNDSGDAGTTVNITTIPSTTQSIAVFIGGGGGGGGGTSTVTAGGAGGAGYASITNPSPDGDVIPITQLNDAWFKEVPVWNSVGGTSGSSTSSSTAVTFGSGAGWYICKGSGVTFYDSSGSSGASSPSFMYFTGTPSAIGQYVWWYSGNNQEFYHWVRSAFQWAKL